MVLGDIRKCRMNDIDKEVFFACPRCKNTINYFTQRVRPGRTKPCPHCQRPVFFKLSGTSMLYGFAPYFIIVMAGSKHLDDIGETILGSVALFFFIVLSIRVTIPPEKRE